MLFALALGLVGLVAVAVLLTIPFRDVTRIRVERFALRQSLSITADNGPMVLRYLATTRRWRGWGLLVSILASLLWSGITGSGVRLTVTALFAGWFVGAIAAEWRVGVDARRADGPRAAASLTPRRLSSYLSVYLRSLLIVSVAAVLIAEVAVEVATTGRRLLLLVPPAGTAVLLVVTTVVARRVLARPQRLRDPGLVAADDALRSRSLRVLTGSAIAASGYLASASVLIASHDASTSSQGLFRLGEIFGGLVLPIVGVLVAMAPSGARSGPSAVLSRT
jgi:hypothetical protein